MMSSSSATVKVDKATSDLLIGPDWTMNLEICDSINSGHWQAKDVVKAVKKRLQHKNPRVQFLALTLLETMIKNCGDLVHFQVVDRGILQEMVKIVTKKTDMQVREKILVMLDSWQQAFGGPGGKYPQYYWAYTELKRSGVEFPKRSQDSALLFSSPASHAQSPPSRYLQIGYGMPNNSSVRLDEAMATDMPNLSVADLDRFRGVMELLSDMLKAVNPSDQEAVKDEVIIDLVSQCRSNQKQLMQLVTSTGDEVLLAQALALNDDLQTILAKNDAIASGAPLPIEASEPIPEPTTPNAETLALTTQSLNIKDEDKEEEEEEDDDFAQLARRNMKNKQVAESSSPTSKEQAMTSTGSTSEPSSSSTDCNSLVLSDPPAPVKISSKEQDMIDLLSLTLSSNPSPPHTPVTPLTPPPNGQNGNFPPQPPPNGQSGNFPPQPPPNGQSGNFPPQPPPTAQGSHYPTQPQPTAQGGNFPSQQPYIAPNQGYVPYNSYVAPWAQAQAQPQPQPQQLQQPQPQTPYNYPLPPWEAYSNPNSNPFMTSNSQFPAPNYAPMHPATQYQQPMQQHYNTSPFYTNIRNVQANATTQTNVRPYVSPNKMLDDLIDLKPSGTSSPRMPGSQGQGMSGSQK